MEIENEFPDPPEENVTAERIEPIAVDIDEIPFDDCKYRSKHIFNRKSSD